MRLGGSLARRRGGKGKKPKKDVSAKAKKAPKAKKQRAGERRPMPWLLIAVLAVFGWGGGYLVATMVIFPAPPPLGDLFEVPDIGGLGLASARERLLGAGLELGAIDSLLHPSVSEALIIGQTPLPGQIARPDAPVDVTISLGPQLRSIPDVTQLDEDGARIVLESSGFRVSIDTAQAEVPRGRVIETLPPADSVLALPAEVRVVVSTGPPVVLMPLVLGLEEDEAVRMLDSLGLVVAEVTEVFRFGRDQGIVVEQEPAADTEMERGSEVRLSVGRRAREREQ
jgi:eukaryotic-like serine/threonine-protein kinase